jgi:cephalosporin hydroxylase
VDVLAARNVRFLVNLLRADPAVWRWRFRDNIRLAREAQARGAIQKARELAPLLALISRRRPRTVVEIGTASGGTFSAWCAVADPRATIVSIDMPGGRFGGGYTDEDIPRLRSYGREGQQLSFLLADSHQESTRTSLSQMLAGAPVDFLMIDGDHSYGGVKCDFELYSPMLSANAVVAFHDILSHSVPHRSDVHVFWNEIKEAYRYLEFMDPQPDPIEGQWGGIGVLYWNK